jgi:hypothetical protein
MMTLLLSYQAAIANQPKSWRNNMRELAKFEVLAVNGGTGEFPVDDPDFSNPQDTYGRYEVLSMRQSQSQPSAATDTTTPTFNLIWHAWPIIPQEPLAETAPDAPPNESLPMM